MAIKSLRHHGHEVIAIGSKEDRVADVVVHTKLGPISDLDTLTLYLNPQRQETYYDYILQLKPLRVIFNPGTENPKFYDILRAHNIRVEEACTLVLLATQQY